MSHPKHIFVKGSFALHSLTHLCDFFFYTYIALENSRYNRSYEYGARKASTTGVFSTRSSIQGGPSNWQRVVSREPACRAVRCRDLGGWL